MIATFEEREYEQEPIVIECEVHRALKEVANEKAPGADEIPIEHFEVLGGSNLNFNSYLCTDLEQDCMA